MKSAGGGKEPSVFLKLELKLKVFVVPGTKGSYWREWQSAKVKFCRSLYTMAGSRFDSKCNGMSEGLWQGASMTRMDIVKNTNDAR